MMLELLGYFLRVSWHAAFEPQPLEELRQSFAIVHAGNAEHYGGR